MFGSEEQKRTLPAAAGARRGARRLGADRGRRRAATPPGCGRRRRGAAASWVLNGAKSFITHGRIGGVMVVMAVTDRTHGHRGISAFIVEHGTPGMTRRQEGEQARDAGERHQRGDLRRLPRAGGAAARRAKGRASSTRCRCSTPAGSASPRCRSASRRAPTRRRATTRASGSQFGQPIAAFQAIQWKLADKATRIEAARLLTYRAAYLKDRRRADDARVVDGQAVRQRDRRCRPPTTACRSTAATAS